MAPTGERGRGQRQKVTPKKRRPRGKSPVPYKFDAVAAAEIIEKVTRGNYLETAAAAAGIARKTLWQWLKRGKAEGKGLLWQFCLDVKKAQATAEANAVQNIGSAATSGIWQAAAWLLERRHPKRWGKREVLEHVGKDGGPILSASGPAVLTSEQRIRRMQELEAKASGQAVAPSADDGSEPPNGG